MCQPASPGSSGWGNRTGIVPPTPGWRTQRPGPSNWSQASPTSRVEPAAANGAPPGGGVVAAHTVRGQLGPDDVLAGVDDVRRDRVADGHEAVGDEPVDLVRAEHRARMTAG